VYTLRVRNVCQALPEGLELLLTEGRWQDSRAGRVITLPSPLTTVYERPQERVLFSAVRDANPFFHLAEAMWMLAGRRDASLLNIFVGDFGERFGEENPWEPGMDGRYIHGAYGFRWRQHFDMEGGGDSPDQLRKCVEMLRANPNDRQVVLAMWDPVADLGAKTKDRPCNTHVYFRVRQENDSHRSLDMTVCCRSNDAIWGAYGANAVHMSFLHEYVALSADLPIGRYYQISNDFHAYESVLNQLQKRAGESLVESLVDDRYVDDTKITPLVRDPERFDGEIVTALEEFEKGKDSRKIVIKKNHFIQDTLWPALMAHSAFKKGHTDACDEWLTNIGSRDWRMACTEWCERRRS